MGKKDAEYLARKYYDRLFRAALFLCNDQETAEDIVQETFTAAVSAIDRFKGRSSYYTWLYGIFLNKFRSWIRKKGKNSSISLQQRAEQFDMPNIGELVTSGYPDTSDLIEQRERAETVREALEELPGHHKEVLTLRYIEDMTYEQISDVLGCSLGTVKSRIHYALKKIGRKLENQPDIKEQ